MDRGARALRFADARLGARPRRSRRASGDGGKPRDVGGVGPSRAGAGRRPARAFPEPVVPVPRWSGSAALRRRGPSRARSGGLGARADGRAVGAIGPAGAAARARARPRRAGLDRPALDSRASRRRSSAARISPRSFCRRSSSSRPRRRSARGIAGGSSSCSPSFAAVGILLSIHGPPGSWLRALPPLDRVRYASKWLAWTAFSVAMLAGLGLDALRFASGSESGGSGFSSASSPSPLSRRGARASAVSGAPRLRRRERGRRAPGARESGRRRWAGALARRHGERGARRGASLWVSPAFPDSRPRAVSDCARRRSRRSRASRAASSRRRWARSRPGPCGTDVRRRRARAAARGAPRLHEPDLPHSRRCARRRRCRRRPRRRCRLRSIAADTALPARRRERPGALDAVSSREPRLAQGRGLLPRAARPYRPRLSFVRSYRIEADPARAWQRVAAGEIDFAREVLLDRRPEPEPGTSTATLSDARHAPRAARRGSARSAWSPS